MTADAKPGKSPEFLAVRPSFVELLDSDRNHWTACVDCQDCRALAERFGNCVDAALSFATISQVPHGGAHIIKMWRQRRLLAQAADRCRKMRPAGVPCNSRRRESKLPPRVCSANSVRILTLEHSTRMQRRSQQSP